MEVLFFDSSGLAKRYLLETGTNWVLNLLKPDTGNVAYISGLTRVEVTSAFKKKERRGDIDAGLFLRAWTQFRYHLGNEYQIIEVAPEALEEAMKLVNGYPLRAYDAVQLATAVALNEEFVALGKPAITFISADEDLNAVAVSEGLRVDNPNHHP